MNSVNKTDDSSFIDYNQCVVMPKNNNTVYILRIISSHKYIFEILNFNKIN
jgi:hypothetical protein